MTCQEVEPSCTCGRVQFAVPVLKQAVHARRSRFKSMGSPFFWRSFFEVQGWTPQKQNRHPTLLHAVPVNHDYRIYLSSASQDALSSPLVVAYVLSFTTVTPRSAPRRVSVMSCPTRRIWFPVIAGMTLCCRAPPTVLIACVLGVFM